MKLRTGISPFVSWHFPNPKTVKLPFFTHPLSTPSQSQIDLEVKMVDLTSPKAVAQLLLDHDPSLCQTRSQGNANPSHNCSNKRKDGSLLDVSRSNGKNALHLAARSGHVEIVKALLDKDPLLARRTHKKGQKTLHMAVKGVSSEVVKLLLEVDAAIAICSYCYASRKVRFHCIACWYHKKRAEEKSCISTSEECFRYIKKLHINK